MKMRAVSVVGLACAVAVLVAGCAVAPPAGSSSSSADRESATRPPSASSPAGVITRPEAAMPTETTAGSSVPAAGAATDSAEGVWITGGSALAVSRDGGAEWQQLPLPDSARVVAAAVLPTEIMAVTGAGTDTLSVSTMAQGQTSWHTTSVAMPPGHQIGNAQMVLKAGVPVGILVTDQSSSQFSRGQWLRAVDGGASWQVEEAPAGGVATAAGGSLWLVGGPVNTELYRSGDDGVSSQPMPSPLAP